jgi:hypothetical protein
MLTLSVNREIQEIKDALAEFEAVVQSGALPGQDQSIRLHGST